MRLLYTFVLDGDSRFLIQGRIFLRSALAAGIPPDDIIAQVTASGGAAGHALAANTGVRSVALQLGPDRRYCNKIMQLFNLVGWDFDVLVACDTDIAILEPLDCAASRDAVRATRVDDENPPLAILDDLKQFLGVTELPTIVSPNCNPMGRTYALNCNGGMLMISRHFVPELGRHWLDYAKRLVAAAARMERWAPHADQVAWAFAMMRLRLPFNELGIEFNFPTVIADRVPADTYGDLSVLHYHLGLDDAQLNRTTGIPPVDAAISRVNAILST